MESLFQDDRGRMWVSTIRGVASFENGRFIPVDSVPGGFVHSIAGDSAGNLWIAHQDQGLFHLLGGSVVERIPWARLGRKDFAYALVPDPIQGGLWLGFYQGGVAYFKDGQVRASYASCRWVGRGPCRRFSTRSGRYTVGRDRGRAKPGEKRPCGHANEQERITLRYRSLGDGRRRPFVLAVHGLRPGAHCPARVGCVGHRSEADDPGLPFSTAPTASAAIRTVNSSYSPHVAKSADGKLWFLTGDGVSVIDPRHLPFNKLPPPVHIEQITADRKTLGCTSSSLRLPALTRDLEIDYTALSLVAPEKNPFSSTSWKARIPTGRTSAIAGRRSIAIFLRAITASASWPAITAVCGTRPAHPSIFPSTRRIIRPRWFQASCVAAFLGLLWVLYRYRLHQIAQEFNVRMEERVAERSRLARDLHDTLLQGFQGLMLRLQALDDLLPAGEAKYELEQTLDRADQVVAEGRKAVHDLRLSTTVTNDLARAVRALGDELSSEDSATFGFLVEGETRELHPIIRDEVYRITREALRNAFSHARARHIEAEITYGDQLFRLRIRDDGEGIAPAILEDGRPGHYGLPGMRERAMEIGAKLDIWSGVGTGTEIDLSIAGSIAYGKRPGRSRLRAFREKAE